METLRLTGGATFHPGDGGELEESRLISPDDLAHSRYQPAEWAEAASRNFIIVRILQQAQDSFPPRVSIGRFEAV